MSARKPILLLCTIMSLFVSVSAWATTYYVDGTNGSNSYNGLYPEYQNGINGPFETIQKAADSISTGDDVLIREGTYQEGVHITTGGTEGNYTVFQPYNGEEVIINPGETYSTWSQDPNGIYSMTYPSYVITDSYFGLIKKDGYGISQVILMASC